MISPTHNIEEFIGVIADKGYTEILLLTEREATEVERHIYRTRANDDSDITEEKVYAETLKELICYLRYSVNPFESDYPNLSIFRTVSQNLDKNERSSI
jgi:hypothetical protein